MQPPARHKVISHATANAWIAKDTRKGVIFLRLRNVLHHRNFGPGIIRERQMRAIRRD
jgi:hypothetical protein